VLLNSSRLLDCIFSFVSSWYSIHFRLFDTSLHWFSFNVFQMRKVTFATSNIFASIRFRLLDTSLHWFSFNVFQNCVNYSYTSTFLFAAHFCLIIAAHSCPRSLLLVNYSSLLLATSNLHKISVITTYFSFCYCIFLGTLVFEDNFTSLLLATSYSFLFRLDFASRSLCLVYYQQSIASFLTVSTSLSSFSFLYLCPMLKDNFLICLLNSW
jgi:hypothetical protein